MGVVKVGFLELMRLNANIFGGHCGPDLQLGAFVLIIQLFLYF